MKEKEVEKVGSERTKNDGSENFKSVDASNITIEKLMAQMRALQSQVSELQTKNSGLETEN